MKKTTIRAKKTERTRAFQDTRDQLWKLAIENHWDDFIRFFFPKWSFNVDFSRQPDFLDKELQRLRVRSRSKNRAVDVLMRVYMLDGTDQTVLVHIEVQAYMDDKFGQRMFQYYYRIYDKYGEVIEAIALLVDDNAHFRPSSFTQKFGDTEIIYKFPIFKLLDNPPPYSEVNIFGYVLETAWHGLKINKLKNENLGELKWNLIRSMLNKGVAKIKIISLLDFISAYLPFEKPEENDNFDREILGFLNESKEEKMTITEFRMKLVREQGIEQGIEQNLADNIISVFEKGYSAESISDLFSQPLEKVEKIIATHQASKR
jgi:hypothetical protein